MIPYRKLYARVRIDAESLASAVATDKDLTRRMSALSERHRTRAWKRIYSHRISDLIGQETRALIEDLKHDSRP